MSMYVLYSRPGEHTAIVECFETLICANCRLDPKAQLKARDRAAPDADQDRGFVELDPEGIYRTMKCVVCGCARSQVLTEAERLFPV